MTSQLEELKTPEQKKRKIEVPDAPRKKRFRFLDDGEILATREETIYTQPSEAELKYCLSDVCSPVRDEDNILHEKITLVSSEEEIKEYEEEKKDCPNHDKVLDCICFWKGVKKREEELIEKWRKEKKHIPKAFIFTGKEIMDCIKTNNLCECKEEISNPPKHPVLERQNAMRHIYIPSEKEVEETLTKVAEEINQTYKASVISDEEMERLLRVETLPLGKMFAAAADPKVRCIEEIIKENEEKSSS